MRPNVLLVVLDSVRAENTSLLGHDRETTPVLEDFAERATVYSEARTSGKWSVPAHTSLFTGLAPDEHGLYDPRRSLKPGETIFDDLQEVGYRTGLFTSNSFLTSESLTGLSHDFETVVGDLEPIFPDGIDPLNYDEGIRSFLRDSLGHKRPVRSLLNGALNKLGWDFPYFLPSKLVRGTSASRPRDAHYVDRFSEWMRDTERPWAACVNLMNAHVPYLPDENRWSSFRTKQRHRKLGMDWELIGEDRLDLLPAFEDLYDGAVRQADAQFGRLLNALRAVNALNNTLVVVVGDHGDGFGEQSEIRGIPVVQHLYGFNEGILHVPVLTKRPGQETGKTVDDLAGLVKFPDLVADCVFGDAESDMRVPELYVSGHLTSNHRDNWERYTGSDPRYDGRVCVKYEDNGEIVKRVTWKSRAIEIVRGKIRPASRKDMDQDFESLIQRGVLEEDTDVVMNEESKKRLADLGYL